MPEIKALKKQGTALTVGQVYTVSDSIALKLVNNGYAEYVGGNPVAETTDSKPEAGVIKQKSK